MPVTRLNARTAVVLIDLQKGITALSTVDSAAHIVARAAALALAARARNLPVVRVRVDWSADGGDALRTRTDAHPAAVPRGPDFAEFDPRVPAAESDIIITKRQWDAFFATELDLQLRRRKVTGIILAGISTSIGVESTARHAHSLGYEIAIASDAVTDMVRSAHENSLTVIFPRIGQVDTTAAIIAAMG